MRKTFPYRKNSDSLIYRRAERLVLYTQAAKECAAHVQNPDAMADVTIDMSPTEGKKVDKALNCWEYMRCGREPGGVHAGMSGVCPAAVEQRLDKVHGGMNAGRACWVVAGTFSRGIAEGTFAREFKDCTKCSFYEMVQAEEGEYAWTVSLLFRLLK
jgi:hypothetical protein